MADREKLIVLIDDIQQNGVVYTPSQMDERYGVTKVISNKEIANHLLANGVTVKTVSHPMTNADRIRAMTDEELKKTLGFFTHINECLNSGCGGCGECEIRELCELQPGQELEWLQQPVEDGATEVPPTSEVPVAFAEHIRRRFKGEV